MACVLRLPGRELKPMHVDETTQALKLQELLNGEYHYDPRDHHGPTLLYATVPVMALTGTRWAELTESRLRLTPVLFGLALVALLGFTKHGFTRMAIGWAALFTAVSPIMVFYSRYYIMETLLVVFTFGCIAFGWRYYISRKKVWLVWSGIFAGLMHATKETCVLHFAAMGGALFLVYAVEYFIAGAGLTVSNRNRRASFSKKHVLLWTGCAGLTSILCFSQFLTDWRGIWDSIYTYVLMFERASGQGHEKPFYYYFSLLWGGFMNGGNVTVSGWDIRQWPEMSGLLSSRLLFVTERLIFLLALVGVVAAFVSKPRRHQTHQLVRFLAIYSVITFLLYSSISYKTPWCILGAWHGCILMAGMGAQVIGDLFFSRAGRIATHTLLFAGAAHLALLSWRLTHDFAADSRNPYNYSMTAADVRDWVGRFHEFAKMDPQGYNMKIMQSDANGAWPLPWHLARQFPNYMWKGGEMDIEGSSVLLLSEGAETILKDQLAAAGQRDAFEERFSRHTLTLHSAQSIIVYVKAALWEQYLARSAAAPLP